MKNKPSAHKKMHEANKPHDGHKHMAAGGVVNAHKQMATGTEATTAQHKVAGMNKGGKAC